MRVRHENVGWLKTSEVNLRDGVLAPHRPTGSATCWRPKPPSAVGSLTRDDLARMRGAVRDMERAHRSADVTAMTAANRRFHFTVFDGTAMPRMADMIRVLWDGTDRYRSLYFATAAHRSRVRAEHAAIMSAVASGDADAAVELCRQHREHALEALCDALPAETGEPPGATAKITRRASQR